MTLDEHLVSTNFRRLSQSALEAVIERCRIHVGHDPIASVRLRLALQEVERRQHLRDLDRRSQ